MLPPSDAAIRAVLDTIHDPCSAANGTPMGLDEMGLIDTLEIGDGGDVAISLRLTSPFCHMIGFFKQEAQSRLLALPGVTSVAFSADNGLDWSPDRMGAAAQQRRTAMLDRMHRSSGTTTTAKQVLATT